MTNALDSEPSPWRSAGVWMSVLIAAFMGLNTVRALVDPGGFAAYFGTPLRGTDGTAFVYVYAIRAAFLGLFAAVLIATGQFRALKWYALAAVVMPLGDALLTFGPGASPAIVARHLATALYLIVTAHLLHRWTQQRT